jgi:hypothetical protein
MARMYGGRAFHQLADQLAQELLPRHGGSPQSVRMLARNMKLSQNQLGRLLSDARSNNYCLRPTHNRSYPLFFVTIGFGRDAVVACATSLGQAQEYKDRRYHIRLLPELLWSRKWTEAIYLAATPGTPERKQARRDLKDLDSAISILG